jgi:hypothetical protein
MIRAVEDRAPRVLGMTHPQNDLEDRHSTRDGDRNRHCREYPGALHANSLVAILCCLDNEPLSAAPASAGRRAPRWPESVDGMKRLAP